MRQMWGERFRGGVVAPIAGWPLGLATFALAFLARWRFGAAMEGLPFVTFFLAVLVTVVIAGWQPAAMVTLLSLLAAWFHFIPPYGSFALIWPSGHVALGFFLIVCVAQIVTVTQLQSALRGLARERAHSTTLLAHQETLYAELQHRVANSIQSLASILSMQASRVANADDAEDALRDAALRLQSVAAVHRQLHAPDLGKDGFARALRSVVEQQLRVAGREDVVLNLDVAADPLAQQDAALIAMIVAEAVANALKHGVRERQGGRLDIMLRDGSEGLRVLQITDDGLGFAILPVPARASLGLVIMEGFARRLGGVLELSNAPAGGARVRVEMPIPATAPAAPLRSRTGYAGSQMSSMASI